MAITNSFQLKGSLFTLTVLQPLTTDLILLGEQLADSVQKNPQFLKYAPVVINLSKINEQESSLDLQVLCQELRTHTLIPIGITNGTEQQYVVAKQLGLASLSASKLDNSAVNKSPAKTALDSYQPPKIIRQTIRSGQQVYADGGDLIVIGSVSPGAELLADGNIHVYGTLRGRALAGIQGNQHANIFCQSLEAELISIAGYYQLNADSEWQINQQAHVYLDENKLQITRF